MNKNELYKALTSNSIEYYNIQGHSFEERYGGLFNYGVIRAKYEVNPYGNCVIHSKIGPIVNAKVGNLPVNQYINFSSQDYLGLSQNKEVINFVIESIQKYGIHTASSPAFTGRNPLIEELEAILAKNLGVDQVVLFTAGWMACFGAIKSLISPKDVILLDAYAHNSLQTGAAATTQNIFRFNHNDLNHLEERLKKLKDKYPNSVFFVVVESLYSMHSDIIDLEAYIDLTQKYDAYIILDIAHDFGVMGQNGLGVLESIDYPKRKNLIIIGAFTKAFSTNGGFVAGPAIIRAQTMLFSPSYTFSNSISIPQTAAALKAAQIIFSSEGQQLRQKLMENILLTRELFTNNGFNVIGKPSPIVPVVVGNDKLSRLIYKHNCYNGLLANLAEFPAVPKNQSLFRFQLMATHSQFHITKAVEIFKKSFSDASIDLNSIENE